jgi:ABC-type Mn2+/Zn2+ transport system permease subunit
MRAARFSVPVTFRNSNFLKAAVGWSVLAAVVLGAYVASGFPAGLTGLVIVIVLFGLASYYLASWSRRTLRVLPDRVVIGHVFSDRCTESRASSPGTGSPR